MERNILAEVEHPFIVKLHYAFQVGTNCGQCFDKILYFYILYFMFIFLYFIFYILHSAPKEHYLRNRGKKVNGFFTHLLQNLPKFYKK
jgi:hypothetical protein